MVMTLSSIIGDLLCILNSTVDVFRWGIEEASGRTRKKKNEGNLEAGERGKQILLRVSDLPEPGTERCGVNQVTDGLRGALEAEGTSVKSQEAHEGVMDAGKCKFSRLAGRRRVCTWELQEMWLER